MAGSSQHGGEDSATVEDDELVMRLNENIDSKFSNVESIKHFQTIDASNLKFGTNIQSVKTSSKNITDCISPTALASKVLTPKKEPLMTKIAG